MSNLKSTGDNETGSEGICESRFKFCCPDCGAKCTARRMVTKAGDIEVNGKKFTGGKHIEVEHPLPLCHEFKSSKVSEYLMEVYKRRATKAKQKEVAAAKLAKAKKAKKRSKR